VPPPAAAQPRTAAVEIRPPAEPPAEKKSPKPAPDPQRRPLVADPYVGGAPPGSADGAVTPPEDLVCFLNEPLWKIEVRRDGTATCTETCDGPPGLRVAETQPIGGKGHPPGWNMKIQKANGASFMSLSVRRTDKCTEEMSHKVFNYEISARRGGGKQYKGCCTPIASAR
jgi:uncharacterized membrane protein